METLNEKARAEVESAIYAGKKIEAIKLYRTAVPGTDLVDAKKAIEDLEDRLRRDHPENFGPPGSKTGCLGILVILAALAGGLASLAAGLLLWS